MAQTVHAVKTAPRSSAQPAPHLIDIVALLVALILFTAYNLIMWARHHKNPVLTIQGVSEYTRTLWVRGVLRENNGILAVQTLRNATMASTFMASTSILLAVGVLSLTGQAENIGYTWHSLNFIGSTGQSMTVFKVLILLVNLFVAFFCFSSSIRLFNHLGFMIGYPHEGQPSEASMRFASAYLNRAATHFYMGMRAFYFMIPLVLWIFGAQFLLLGTVGTIIFIYLLDRTPSALRHLAASHEVASVSPRVDDEAGR